MGEVDSSLYCPPAIRIGQAKEGKEGLRMPRRQASRSATSRSGSASDYSGSDYSRGARDSYGSGSEFSGALIVKKQVSEDTLH